MKTLTLEDYKKVSFDNQITVSKIMAVDEVESKGKGFRDDGSPTLLYEGHIFRSLTNGKYDQSHPHLSFPYSIGKEKRQHYYNQNQVLRVNEARKLDRDAADCACSWGRFQVMGMNWQLCGYSSIQDFMADIYESEQGHLRTFVGYIKNKVVKDPVSGIKKICLEWLREGRYDLMAFGYNGKGYKTYQYDTKIEKADKKFSAQGYDYIPHEFLGTVNAPVKAEKPLMDDTLKSSLAKPARWSKGWWKWVITGRN